MVITNSKPFSAHDSSRGQRAITLGECLFTAFLKCFRISPVEAPLSIPRIPISLSSRNCSHRTRAQDRRFTQVSEVGAVRGCTHRRRRHHLPTLPPSPRTLRQPFSSSSSSAFTVISGRTARGRGRVTRPRCRAANQLAARPGRRRATR